MTLTYKDLGAIKDAGGVVSVEQARALLDELVKVRADADEVNRNAATQLESAAQYIAEQRTSNMKARIERLEAELKTEYAARGDDIKRLNARIERMRDLLERLYTFGDVLPSMAEVKAVLAETAALAPSGDGGGA